MFILQNPHDNLYKSTLKLFPSRACSVQAIVPILLPIQKFGLAPIPHGHLTRHNGLYTEHRTSYAPPLPSPPPPHHNSLLFVAEKINHIFPKSFAIFVKELFSYPSHCMYDEGFYYYYYHYYFLF
jgi:hypothetical protein